MLGLLSIILRASFCMICNFSMCVFAALTIHTLECSKMLRMVELYNCDRSVGLCLFDKLEIALSRFNRAYVLFAIFVICCSHESLLSNTTPR